MQYRYVPNLRWKRGEKAALKHLSTNGHTDVQPLFLLGADQFKAKKATKNNPALPAPRVVAEDIAAYWGTDPFFLDASSLSSTGLPQHRLSDIAAECRNLGLSLIPCADLGMSSSYAAAISAIVHVDGRGVGLRIDLQELTSMPSWIGSWVFPLAETDLIVNFGDQAQQVHSLGNILISAFQSIASGWRSVTMVGTSMPENFVGLSAGTHLLPRFEKHIWDMLNSAPLPYRLDFGDYATVSLAPPPPGIAWGYPISVRYTLPNETLICRGVRTKGVGAQDMDVQLLGHAKTISNYGPARGSLPHCWADQEIDDIANGNTNPGNLEHWVRIGVNRHIELVRSMLP